MENLSNFLEISFVETLLKPTILKNDYYGNSHENKKFVGVSKQNVKRWKERISKEEAMIIEFFLKDLMSYWNYELEFNELDSQKAFSKFYEWYNCKYFFYDSFKSNDK